MISCLIARQPYQHYWCFGDIHVHGLCCCRLWRHEQQPRWFFGQRRWRPIAPTEWFCSSIQATNSVGGFLPLFDRSRSLLRLTQIVFQYYLSGLSNDTHTITLTNTETNSSKFFDLDRFVVSQYLKTSTPAGSSGSQRGSTGGRFASHTFAFVTHSLLILLHLLHPNQPFEYRRHRGWRDRRRGYIHSCACGPALLAPPAQTSTCSRRAAGGWPSGPLLRA
jgi:hypothetical protein